MKIPYGFTTGTTGKITVDKAHAEIVQMIYREYLIGNSLGRISNYIGTKTNLLTIRKYMLGACYYRQDAL